MILRVHPYEILELPDELVATLEDVLEEASGR